MQVDKAPFRENVLESNNLAILVRLDQARTIAEKNAIVGEPRKDEPNTILVTQVALEKDKDGKNKLKIIVGSTGGHSMWT
jgi:hypothetical protein